MHCSMIPGPRRDADASVNQLNRGYGLTRVSQRHLPGRVSPMAVSPSQDIRAEKKRARGLPAGRRGGECSRRRSCSAGPGQGERAAQSDSPILFLRPYALSSLSLSCHDNRPVVTFWYIVCSRSKRCLAKELSSGTGAGEGLRETCLRGLRSTLFG